MLPPLVFQPYFRPQVWGETRLQRLLGKSLPAGQRIGESWEISGHALHVSRVAEGIFAGASLNQLWGLHRREFLGFQSATRNVWQDRQPFPLLIKLLDCHDWLSVQVHPSDMAARELLGEPNGKTEAWIVLHAEPGSRIYAGLKQGVRRCDLESHLDHGTLAECLHTFEPQPGDCLLIEAGTVHAVGGGVLLAEIQQTSDATLRLFDWNRLDANGRPRELHREAALQCINFDSGPVEPVRRTQCSWQTNHRISHQRLDRSFTDESYLSGIVDQETLITSDYFSLDAVHLEVQSRMLDDEPLTLWMVLSGTATLLNSLTGYERTFAAGECVMIPADSQGLTWLAGNASLLRIEPTLEHSPAIPAVLRSRQLATVG